MRLIQSHLLLRKIILLQRTLCLRPIAIYAENQESQRIKHAKNIFDERTAQFIEANFPNDPKWQAIAQYFRAMHNGYQVMTSHDWEPQEDKLHCPLGMHYNEQLAALEKMKWYFQNTTFKTKNGKSFKNSAPFIKGMLITINANIQLHQDLVDKYDEPLMLTEWTTQESFKSK